MKLMQKIGFNLNSVQAGQKSSTVNAEPQLICNSTTGKFTITAAVSKAMQVPVGANIMFVNNIAQAEALVANPNKDCKDWAAENGIDLTTKEGQDALMKELLVWGIAKGVPMVDTKGNPVMAKERYSKDDKMRFIEANADEILANNREALIERNGGEDADDETLKSLITIDDVEVPEYHVHTGSKTATTGNATGIGCQLNFTDTAIWNHLKKDVPADDRVTFNRVFKVDIENPIEAKANDGSRDGIVVMAYPIEFLSDEKPMVRGAKDEEDED